MKFLSLSSILILSIGYKINRPIIRKMFISNDDTMIVNKDLPSCQNCIYNKPYKYLNEYTSSLNSCTKFGEKIFYLVK